MAETEAVKLGIEIMSMETLKPSSSTLSNPKTYTLSVLDQTFPATHFDILLVYNNSTCQTKLDIPHLKRSLMDTLSRFYPFAGRCDNESIISCNDEGIPFLTTRVDCSLSGGFGSLTGLLPPVDLISARRRPVSELVPLAFQINVFACGGIVIGCYMFHKVMDAASFGTFLQYWAGLTTGQVLVEPDFKTAVAAFPPSPKVNKFTVTGIDATVLGLGSAITVVAKSFLFSTHALNELKARAASVNPTRFEALGAFVWKHAFAAACDAGAASPASPTRITIAANIRSRTDPPLPQGSIGNLVVNVPAQVEKQTGFSDLAIEIHESLASQIITNIIQDFKGEDGAEAVIAYRKALGKEVLDCKPYFYKLSSWSNLAFNEADFGFGKPERIIPFTGGIYPLHRNFIFFNDYASSTENGIEVRLLLEENEMQILESNPVFRALATPMQTSHCPL